MSAVVITHNDMIVEAINQALDQITVEQLIKDRIVALKPNETYANEADKTGVTQPETLRAVIRYIKKFSPKELIISGGSGAARTDQVFRVAGLMEVVESESVIFHDHNLPPLVEVALDYGEHHEVHGPQEAVMVNERILSYETIIALNQLKVHSTATVTMALKNIAMSFPAADYYGYPRSTQKHQNHFFEDMHSFIAAMYKRFPINLAITVGHPAMVGTGPLGGHAVETGLVIASLDALAADAVGAKILGFQVQAVRHLWEAGKLGLGEVDIKKLDYPALSLEEAIKIFSNAVYGKEIKSS